MKLPFRVSSLEEVPKAFYSLYQKDGDGFARTADAEIEVPDTAVLEGTLAKLRGELRDAKSSAQRAKILDDLGLDETKLREMIDADEARKRADAEKKGEYDKLLQSVKEQSGRELQKVQARADGALNTLKRVMRENAAIAAIMAKGGSVKALTPHVMSALDVDIDESSWQTTVRVLEGGKPALSPKSGEPKTVEELVAGLMEDPDFKPLFKGGDASGGGARGSGGGTTGGTRGAAGGRIEDGKLVISNEEAGDIGRYRALRAEATAKGLTLAVESPAT